MDTELDLHSGTAALIAIYLNVDCFLLVGPMFTKLLGRAVSARSMLLTILCSQVVLLACGFRDFPFIVWMTMLWTASSTLTIETLRRIPVTGPSHGRTESARWYAMVAGFQAFVAFLFIESLARSGLPESMAWHRTAVRTAIVARWLKDLAELANGARAAFGQVRDNDAKATRILVGMANLLPGPSVVGRGLFYCDLVTVVCCVFLFVTLPLCAVALAWLVLSLEFENFVEYRRVAFN